jgi:voltage-gated potassium channel
MHTARLKQVIALLLAVMLGGTIGYHFIEGWSFFDAFYMTTITLATVGYGETHPLSFPGRVFTIFLIFGGMGIILYGVTEMTAFIVEGEMSGLLRRRRLTREIAKLSGHYIVCGGGRTGSNVLAELLLTQRHAVVVDTDAEIVRKLLKRDALAIEGDATQDDVLRAAGIERAAGLCTALHNERDNLFVIITARGLNPKLRLVSSIQDPRSREKFLRSGADSTVNAHFIGGLRLASELMRPDTVTFLDLMLRDRSQMRFDDLHVPPHSRFAGKAVGDCDAVLRQAGLLPCALRKSTGLIFNPPASAVLEGGDTLVVMGSPEQIAKGVELVNQKP